MILLILPHTSKVTANDVTTKGDLNKELNVANKLMAEEKYEEAYQELIKYAEYNQLAQFNLGVMALNGWGGEANHPSACEWFEKSAQEDIPMAQELLGNCYRDGIHKNASFDMAKKWYLRAVDNGLPTSYCNLGKIYFEGKLVKKNQRKGIRFCEQAGEAGSIQTQLFLAKNFDIGGIFKQDLSRTLYWYNVAASANNTEAQYQFARILFNNNADNKGHNMAVKAAESAAIKGYQPAYILTAKLYINAPLDSNTQLPTSDNLAKAYMWAQATLRQDIETKDKIDIKEMLNKIRTVMPKTWEEDLNGEVDDHFERLSSANAIMK